MTMLEDFCHGIIIPNEIPKCTRQRIQRHKQVGKEINGTLTFEDAVNWQGTWKKSENLIIHHLQRQ